MDLSQSDSGDNFQRFLEASNEDDESITMKRSTFKPPRGGGVGDSQRSQQYDHGMGARSSYGSQGSGGMGMSGGMGGRYSGHYDPYDIDLPTSRPAPAPKLSSKPKEPQVRKSQWGDSAMDRASQKLRQSNQSKQLEEKEEKESKANASKSSSSHAPPMADQAAKADLSDSESKDSESLQQTQDDDAPTKSEFASLFAAYQKMEQDAAETVKLEEERKKKEAEERKLQEEEDERRRLEEIEQAERKRLEELEKRKQEEEERKQKELEEAKRKKEQEEANRRKQEEEKREEDRLRLEAEAKKKGEEKRKVEEDRKRQEDEAKHRAEKEEAERKKKEDEAKQKEEKKEDEAKQKEEDEKRRKLAEFKRQVEEANQKKETEERKLKEEQEAAQRLLEEEKEEEERRSKQAEMKKEEENRRDDEAIKLSMQNADMATRQRNQDEEEVTRRHADIVGRGSEGFHNMGASSTDRLEALRSRDSSDDVCRFGQESDDSQMPQTLRQAAKEPSLQPGGQASGSRPNVVTTSAGSDPLFASVRDSLGSVPSSGVALGAAMNKRVEFSHDDDQSLLPCDLLLRSTESAELEEKNAFFRHFAQSGMSLPPAASTSFDVTSSLLLDPKLKNEIMATAGLHQSTKAPSGLGRSSGARRNVLDRTKFESLDEEVQALRNEVAILEEHNKELTAAKIQVVEEVARLEQQSKWLSLENRKLEDERKEKSAQLREATLSQHEVERKLFVAEKKITEQIEIIAREVAAAKKREEQWAARVSALDSEIAGLREENEGLKEDVLLAPSTIQPRAVSGTGGSERGSDNDLFRLQKELRMMEDMLRGCEKENQNLAQQNKQLRQNARLRKEEVDNQQLKLVSDLNNARASAETNPASMRRVSELEKELVASKERSDELAKELDRCREGKRQLERELLNGAPAVQSDEDSAKLAEAVAGRLQAEADVGELRQKINWYLESQREMEEDRHHVVRLGEEVRTLRAENAELKRRPSTKETHRRADELKKQVEELQECLRKRNPDSILSLMKACEPKPEERKELRNLKGRVEELEAKLTERDETYERQVRSLRANYDRMRLEYERRTGAGGDTGATDGGTALAREETRRAAPDREAVLQARIKDLERQVEHTKSYYLTKMRKREPLVPPKPTRSVTGANAQHRESELLLELRDRDARIESLTKELHFRKIDEADKPIGGIPVSSIDASALRLFLASPEAPPIISISVELRAMATSARRRRYDEVVSQARSLTTFLAAQEAVSMPAASARTDAQHDRNVLRLQAQPAFAASVWSIWRSLCEQVASVAAEAALRSEDGCTGGEGMESDVFAAIAKFAGCLDNMLYSLLGSPASLIGHGYNAYPLEAWAPQQQHALVESLLPRMLLEHLCEELHVAGPGHLVAALQDAQVHAGPDGRLRWSELEGVLARGNWAPRLIHECRSAAHPDFTISLRELQQFFDAGQRSHQSPCTGLLRTLTRIRLAAPHHEPPLTLLFRSLDAAGRGFVSRADFMEALRGLCCALSSEERGQLAMYFSPATEPQLVNYPLFLQSIVPLQGDKTEIKPSWPDAMMQPTANRWAEPQAAPLLQSVALRHGSVGSAAQLDALTRKAELEVENTDLREQVRQLTHRCAENAALIAQSPAQTIMRLQGEMAALETRMLEQHTALSTGSRKAEITLRGELEVCRHEASTLRLALDAKDQEVEHYKKELEAIIGELMSLKSVSAIASS